MIGIKGPSDSGAAVQVLDALRSNCRQFYSKYLIINVLLLYNIHTKVNKVSVLSLINYQQGNTSV